VKTCRTCKAEKPLRQFYRHPHYADGRMSDCKECKKAYAREMHWLKREVILARKRQYNATPERIAKRVAYARTPRGRQIKRESRLFARIEVAA
jgi:hypothetical protein